jgi:putative addiction module killer protein
MFEIETTEVFDKWRDKLKDTEAKDRIRARLVLMSRGILGDTKPVGNGVFEARIHHGAGYRLYFIN